MNQVDQDNELDVMLLLTICQFLAQVIGKLNETKEEEITLGDAKNIIIEVLEICTNDWQKSKDK